MRSAPSDVDGSPASSSSRQSHGRSKKAANRGSGRAGAVGRLRGLLPRADRRLHRPRPRPLKPLLPLGVPFLLVLPSPPLMYGYLLTPSPLPAPSPPPVPSLPVPRSSVSSPPLVTSPLPVPRAPPVPSLPVPSPPLVTRSLPVPWRPPVPSPPPVSGPPPVPSPPPVPGPLPVPSPPPFLRPPPFPSPSPFPRLPLPLAPFRDFFSRIKPFN